MPCFLFPLCVGRLEYRWNLVRSLKFKYLEATKPEKWVMADKAVGRERFGKRRTIWWYKFPGRGQVRWGWRGRGESMRGEGHAGLVSLPTIWREYPGLWPHPSRVLLSPPWPLSSPKPDLSAFAQMKFCSLALSHLPGWTTAYLAYVLRASIQAHL